MAAHQVLRRGEGDMGGRKHEWGAVVAVGGGSGPSLAARAFRDLLERVTAVVCTTDTGSSSGLCRRAFGLPAPGDVRATLSTFASLSGDSPWADLWEKRLESPLCEAYHGMALGNLLLCGLAQEEGGFARAVQKASSLLGIRGRVLPVTEESAQLRAELVDGTVVMGEAEIRRVGKPPIRSLGWEGPVPTPAPGVLEALEGADLILLGPGCLYTSILPCLMVQGVREALHRSGALRVYLCNSTVTPGQTDGYSALKHVETVMETVGKGGVDWVLMNNLIPPEAHRRAYEEAGLSLVLPDHRELRLLEESGLRVLLHPLLEETRPAPRRLHKADTFRHSPERVREALDRIVSETRRSSAPFGTASP